MEGPSRPPAGRLLRASRTTVGYETRYGARACLTKVRLGFGWDGGVHDRHDLSDEQWALLEPLLPVERTGRQGRPWTPHRRVVNAILWRTRTGSPWRDLPAAYGSWQTVYGRHRTWSGDGTWDRVLARVAARQRRR